MRRVIFKDETTIAEHVLSQDITVKVSCYAAFEAVSNFSSHEDFERSNKGTASSCSHDRQKSFHPFDTGPHNWIKQSLT